MSDQIVVHAGVKGMKWGVRKDRGNEGKKAKTSKIEKLDKKFEKNSQAAKTTFALYNSAAEKTNKFDIDRINNKPEYANVDFSRDSPLRQKYYKEHQRAMLDNLHKAAKEMGTNASGTKEYGIVENPNGSWDVTVNEVKHSANVAFRVVPNYTSTGHIKSLKIEETTMSHSDISKTDILIHAGVKGMRWGVRKSRDEEKRAATFSKLKDKGGKADVHKLSDDELRSRINRMQMERKYAQLNPGALERGKQRGKALMGAATAGVAIYNLVKSPAGKAAIDVGKNLFENSAAKNLLFDIEKFI